MKRPSKCLILPFLLLQTAGAALAQESGKDSLRVVFSRYVAEAPQEKLFVHIDRSVYLAGETIWFKVYDFDAGTDQPAALSGIAYIEILDADQHAVLQAKIGLNAGKGDGSFSIPLSVPSGEYLFRAYTSWMKNFSPDLYYSQALTIFNTLNDAGTDSAQPARAAAADNTGASIRLFPEGGNLVAGLASTIAVTTTGRNGRPVPCDGVVYDAQKDTVARFHTGAAGTGRFILTPTAGVTYTATATIDHSAVDRPLPAAYDKGYVMHVEEQDDRRIRVTVQVAGSPVNPAVYLFVHTGARIRLVEINFLRGNATSFVIDKDSLDAGISHLTLFNGDRQPVCERLWFRQPKRLMHIGIEATTSTSASASAFPSPAPSSRTRLAIDLTTTDNTGAPIAADLSMSVFRLDSLQSIPNASLLTWLLLGSELKGPVDLPPGWDAGPDSGGILDDLMLTRGWSRFRWEDILGKSAFEFLPERDGPIVTAKLVDRRTGQPPRPMVGYLAIPGIHPELATALSMQSGALYFHLGSFYGSRNLVALTNNQVDSNVRLEIANPWSDRFAAFPLPAPGYSRDWSKQLLQRSIDAQAENAYRSADRHRFSPVTEDTLAFYGTSDLSYNLDDYTRFVTLEEVIQEFVDNVRIRRKSGRPYFRVRNALFNIFFDDGPLLLIDGVPVFNADRLIDIDPGKIKTIDVVSHKYILGPSVTDGIVAFRSFDGEMAGYELDPNAVAFPFAGLQLHREFYTPVYDGISKGQPSIPDFREELLWAPDINTGATGKITQPVFTSDLTGKFAVVVQGVGQDGLPGYALYTFSVVR